MTELKDYLVLSVAAEWKLCAFFRAIGLKKPGEPFVMKWNMVEGRKGSAHIVQETYTKKDGTSGTSNKIKNYVDGYAEEAESEVPFDDDPLNV